MPCVGASVNTRSGFRLGRRDGPFLHFDILAGRSVPGEVKFHAVLLDLSPYLWSAEEIHSPPDGRHQVGRRVSLEFEAISTGFCSVLDGIFQAASAPHNRGRSVAEAVHLTESARLIA